MIHGFRTMVLEDENGDPRAGAHGCLRLDYPAWVRNMPHLHRLGRVHYSAADDREALEAFYVLSRREGIIPRSKARMRSPLPCARPRPIAASQS